MLSEVCSSGAPLVRDPARPGPRSSGATLVRGPARPGPRSSGHAAEQASQPCEGSDRTTYDLRSRVLRACMRSADATVLLHGSGRRAALHANRFAADALPSTTTTTTTSIQINTCATVTHTKHTSSCSARGVSLSSTSARHT